MCILVSLIYILVSLELESRLHVRAGPHMSLNRHYLAVPFFLQVVFSLQVSIDVLCKQALLRCYSVKALFRSSMKAPLRFY